MADIFRLSALSENTNLQTRYNNMLAGNLPANGVYESIQTVTVGSGGASSVSFTSIPSTYKHLQIRTINGSPTGGSGAVAITSSGATFAYRHYLYGTGSSVASGGDTSNSILADTVNSPNIFSANIIDILDYTNVNKNKTIRNLCGTDLNGSGSILFFSALLTSTSIITDITLTPTSSSFSQYSSFALYGIKG